MKSNLATKKLNHFSKQGRFNFHWIRPFLAAYLKSYKRRVVEEWIVLTTHFDAKSDRHERRRLERRRWRRHSVRRKATPVHLKIKANCYTCYGLAFSYLSDLTKSKPIDLLLINLLGVVKSLSFSSKILYIYIIYNFNIWFSSINFWSLTDLNDIC